MSANLSELIAALHEFREEWNCDQATATYVTPSGDLVTLSVLAGLVTVTDDKGNVVVVGD